MQCRPPALMPGVSCVTNAPTPSTLHSNGKAWYRQALAHQALRQPQAAIAAAQHAAQCMPNATVLALLQQLQSATALPACAIDGRIFPSPLSFTYVPNSHSNYNLLILLHGLGDTQQPFAQLARSMELPDTAAVAVGGPEQVAETGGRAWFAVEWVDDSQGDLTVQVGCIDTLSTTWSVVRKLVSPNHKHSWSRTQHGATRACSGRWHCWATPCRRFMHKQAGHIIACTCLATRRCVDALVRVLTDSGCAGGDCGVAPGSAAGVCGPGAGLVCGGVRDVAARGLCTVGGAARSLRVGSADTRAVGARYAGCCDAAVRGRAC